MKIAIIGAGVGGMSAAWDLVRAGHPVTIYEAANFVGGLASGFKEPHWDWSVEKFYHHWFQSDAYMLGLLKELQLDSKVLFPRPYTVLFHNNKWYPFDSILNALLFPGLGWGINKVRFGLVGLYLRTTNNWRALEQHTVETWMRKWAGDRVYEQMWQPLLIGKFGPFYKEVNMAWMWGRLKARTTRLGTYQGGFQQFSDDFAEKLRGMGVTFAMETPIQTLYPAPAGGITLQPTNMPPATYEQVLVTLSPGQFSQMVPDLPFSYLAGLKSLQHMGAVVLILSLKHQLSEEGYYWFNIPKNLGYPFLAVVEHTNFVSPKHFGGDHILYCGDYLPVEHEYFSLSKEQLVERFLPALQQFNPKLKPEWIKQTWLFSTKYAQPVPLINHSRNIPAIQTPIPGLYFASMSQVYPWDRGTNFAVEIGRRAARMMMKP
ncbi:MAG: NAD(P)/FAD-dependent oxidoreductase [Anaerolineales bacterium]